MSDANATGQDPTVAGEPQATPPASGDSASTPPTTAAAPGTEPQAAEVVYDFQAPEGVELNQGDLEQFKSIAKDLKLPKDAAQKVVDLAVARETARQEAFVKQVEDWGTAVKSDKELGLPENLALAAKAVDTFGTPELKALLNSTGLGNHPEVVRAFLKAGKAISEDKVVGKAGVTNAPRDAAQILYGTPSN